MRVFDDMRPVSRFSTITSPSAALEEQISRRGFTIRAYLFPCTLSLTTLISFLFRNTQFSASSRKSRNCTEAYSCMPHKEFRRLTPKLQKRAIYGRKLTKGGQPRSFFRPAWPPAPCGPAARRGPGGSGRASRASAPPNRAGLSDRRGPNTRSRCARRRV